MPTIFSVGHSTRSAEELVALLREVGVHVVADVRRFPSSRRHPHFERSALERTLADARIAYWWLGEALGGRQPERLPAAQSPNRGWKVPAFRRYADGMTRPAFEEAFGRLATRALERPTALLCAERLWWQCHRRLLADLLTVRGWRVVHLLEPGKASEHTTTEWARVEDGRLTYPGLV